jgi:Zn finger protein HypA/HybF involved in hydrogenase expression
MEELTKQINDMNEYANNYYLNNAQILSNIFDDTNNQTDKKEHEVVINDPKQFITLIEDQGKSELFNEYYKLNNLEYYKLPINNAFNCDACNGEVSIEDGLCICNGCGKTKTDLSTEKEYALFTHKEIQECNNTIQYTYKKQVNFFHFSIALSYISHFLENS